MATELVGHRCHVQINGSVVDLYWQCLGMYAPPGWTIDITVPASLIAVGATMHIGGWTDVLYSYVELKQAHACKLAMLLPARLPFLGTVPG